MSDEANIGIVQTYVDCLGRGEMEKVGQLLADDVVWHQPGNSHLSGLLSGKEEVSRI